MACVTFFYFWRKWQGAIFSQKIKVILTKIILNPYTNTFCLSVGLFGFCDGYLDERFVLCSFILNWYNFSPWAQKHFITFNLVGLWKCKTIIQFYTKYFNKKSITHGICIYSTTPFRVFSELIWCKNTMAKYTWNSYEIPNVIIINEY